MAEVFLLVEAIHAALPDVSPARCRIAALNVQKVLDAEDAAKKVDQAVTPPRARGGQ